MHSIRPRQQGGARQRKNTTSSTTTPPPALAPSKHALHLSGHCVFALAETFFNVLKTHDTTPSKTWLEVSSNMIPRVPLYKSRTCLKMIQDTQQSPTHKSFALHVNILDLVRIFFEVCLVNVLDGNVG